MGETGVATLSQDLVLERNRPAMTPCGLIIRRL
jgi:hypothetical protein